MGESAAQPRLPGAFWKLWWSAAIATTGEGAFAAAVPLMAVAATQDSRLISLVSAATYLPWLLLSLPAGAVVDRNDRVGLMWRAQATQALIVGVVALLATAGQISIATLAIMALGLGACEVVYSIAAQAVLPDIVAKRLLHTANGAQQAVVTIGRQFLGPPLGSLLVVIAVVLPLALTAVSFAVSAALVVTLPRRPRINVERQPFRAAIAEGLRWLRGHRLLRTLAVLLGVNTFCGQLGNATLVLLATQTLQLHTGGFGVLLAGAAVGGVIGGLVNARVVIRIGELRSLLVSLAANAVIFVAIGFSPNVIVLGMLLAANGFVTVLWTIVTVGLRQQLVPSELLGRVNSVYKMLGWGLMPLGAVAGGLLAHWLGLRAPFPIAGVLRGIALAVTAPILIAAMRS